VTVLAAQNPGVFLVDHFLLPFLGTLLVVLVLGGCVKAVRRRVARAWAGSALRRRFLAVSKAKLCLLIAVLGNLFVVLQCSPLLRVPVGSEVKPVALPFLMLLTNAGTLALCGKVAKQAERPDGSMLLQVLVLVLRLTPFVGGVFLMNLIAAVRNRSFG
jgi:hypothetical protein